MGFETTNKIINERINEISYKLVDKTITERERNELAELIYPKLRYYIWQYCKHNEDTDEALQWTLKKIFNNIPKFNIEKGRFTTWIYTIARNETLFFLYQKKRSPITNLTTLYSKKSSEGSKSTDSSWLEKDKNHSIDVFHEGEHEFDRLYNITISEIHEIKDELLRNIAVDKMLKKEKVKNIAIKYNINENTVKTKLRKVRMDIKEKVLDRDPTFKETLNHMFNI